MRTSLNNIKAIEDYLSGKITPGETLLFEANTLLNTDLKNDIQYQQNTYALVKEYSRQQIKIEILAVQKTFVNSPQNQGLMQRISNLFKKH